MAGRVWAAADADAAGAADARTWQNGGRANVADAADAADAAHPARGVGTASACRCAASASVCHSEARPRRTGFSHRRLQGRRIYSRPPGAQTRQPASRPRPPRRPPEPVPQRRPPLPSAGDAAPGRITSSPTVDSSVGARGLGEGRFLRRLLRNDRFRWRVGWLAVCRDTGVRRRHAQVPSVTRSNSPPLRAVCGGRGPGGGGPLQTSYRRCPRAPTAC